jgi:hypothetical protein
MVHGGEECGDVGAAIGIRVGVGLSLTSAPWAGDWSRPELRRLVTDGADYKVTFDEFLYYLRVFFFASLFHPSIYCTISMGF